jgi:uncharacterized protein (TIGR02145 family)
MVNANASDSICPKNWRLPIGGEGATTASNAITTNNEFAKLDIAMGGTGQTRTNANTFTKWTTSSIDGQRMSFYLTGNYSTSGSWGSSNVRGFLWTSTAGSTSTYAYRLNLNSTASEISIAAVTKPNIFTVRCIVGS